MSETSRRAAATGDGPRPTVIVDDVHVDYTVLATGRRADRSRSAVRRPGALRRSRTVHALRGVSFTAHEGDSIGVVGHNGSGKSTLMRAVAGLATPSRGAVYAEGRPALLGVNAALINDLTGERNIVLGGLALGMTTDEVRERYDEIVDFSGVRHAIDLPMATYSSGMGARLRFAIASAAVHRVLLIDEALAVGDAAFRRRSEERIKQLRERAGTVFLVSHSMGTIRETCNRVLWVHEGRLRADGPTAEVLPAYRRSTR